MVQPRLVMPDGDPDITQILRMPAYAERVAALGGITVFENAPRSPGEFSQRISGFQAVLLGAKLPDEVMREAEAMRLISFAGYGVANYVNLAIAAERGITVTNTPHYGDAAVAEHTIALLLAVARNVLSGDRAVRGGDWRQPQGIQLAGKTAGIVGYGGIGARVAAILEAMGMRVLVWTRRQVPSRLDGTQHRFADLPELMSCSDVVSLHLALDDSTWGILDAALLGLMRRGAILVNTARAELIEQGALEALVAKGALRAGLDVFTSEPLPADSPLCLSPAVVMSPHQAYNTPGSLERMLDVAVGNVKAFFEGCPVNVIV